MSRLSGRRPTAELENCLRVHGFTLVAGVDEVGRGPLAGPVVAAAVVLEPDWPDPGINDSKRLSPAVRTRLAEIIQTSCVTGVGWCEASEVDQINIHRASLLAMKRAVQALPCTPHYLVLDGRFTLDLALPQQAVVKADTSCLAVAAASIIAKVRRDNIMLTWHQTYPQYNFAAHKGYPTPEHLAALQQYGPCPIHRRSYAPVKQIGLLS